MKTWINDKYDLRNIIRNGNWLFSTNKVKRIFFSKVIVQYNLVFQNLNFRGLYADWKNMYKWLGYTSKTYNFTNETTQNSSDFNENGASLDAERVKKFIRENFKTSGKYYVQLLTPIRDAQYFTKSKKADSTEHSGYCYHPQNDSGQRSESKLSVDPKTKRVDKDWSGIQCY